MTSRQVYEALLIEIHKENAPDILLEDFNYLFNKAINNYVNKRYNIYDINQQTSDDLRVLKSSALLTPHLCENYSEDDIGSMMGATYEVIMPSDYLHILNCICIYNVNKTFKCYDAGKKWRRPATRLTADLYSQVLDNFWLRPTYKRPYYYIHNVNTNDIVPTDPIREVSSTIITNPTGTAEKYYVGLINESNFEREELFTLFMLSVNDLTIKNNEIMSFDIKSELHGNLYIVLPKNKKLNAVYDINNMAYNLLKEKGRYGLYIVYYIPNFSTSGRFQLKMSISNTGESSTGGSSSEESFRSYNVGTDIKLGGITNPNSTEWTDGFDNNIGIVLKGNGVSTSIDIRNASGKIESYSSVERTAQIRYGNSSSVRMEIRYGTDTKIFQLTKVLVDYIKAPQFIRLTQDQLDMTEDTSLVLEFPDYVCQEIIKELVIIVMENISDPKLQTYPVVNLSIANPAQQLTEPVALAAQ